MVNPECWHHQVMIRMWSNNSNSLLGRMQNGTAMLENNLMVSNITLLYNPAMIFSDINGAEDISTQNLHYIESSCKAGDLGLIHGSGRSFGKGNGNPLHYSCMENSMDRGVWRAVVHRVTKSSTTEQLLLLLITPQTWKQPMCPSANEWINKLYYI